MRESRIGDIDSMPGADRLLTNSEFLHFDEPASVLDPIVTAGIERLGGDLESTLIVSIVMHNMHQTAHRRNPRGCWKAFGCAGTF